MEGSQSSFDRRNDDPTVAVTVRESVRDHERRLRTLESFKDELKGAMTLVKFTLGSSLITGILAIAAILHLIPGGK